MTGRAEPGHWEESLRLVDDRRHCSRFNVWRRWMWTFGHVWSDTVCLGGKLQCYGETNCVVCRQKSRGPFLAEDGGSRLVVNFGIGRSVILDDRHLDVTDIMRRISHELPGKWALGLLTVRWFHEIQHGCRKPYKDVSIWPPQNGCLCKYILEPELRSASHANFDGVGASVMKNFDIL